MTQYLSQVFSLVAQVQRGFGPDNELRKLRPLRLLKQPIETSLRRELKIVGRRSRKTLVFSVDVPFGIQRHNGASHSIGLGMNDVPSRLVTSQVRLCANWRSAPSKRIFQRELEISHRLG